MGAAPSSFHLSASTSTDPANEAAKKLASTVRSSDVAVPQAIDLRDFFVSMVPGKLARHGLPIEERRLAYLQLEHSVMSKLAAIKKQIAALEAQAERIARQEMAGAIAKVKEIMSTFGLTVEHLQSTAAGKTRNVAKKMKPKRTSGGVAKYADPKTGKTWSGVGRAPAWIAGARNRDAFLIDKSGVQAPEAAVKAPVAKKKSAAKKGSKPMAKKAAAAAKKAAPKTAAPLAGKKKPSAKKTAPKAAAKKAAKKRATPVGAAGTSTATAGAAPSAT